MLNQTFMGERLRDFHGREVPVRVRKDPAGLSVFFDDVHVLSATVDAWAPRAGWAFGFGGRTGERKDDHFIDELRVQSGFLLDLGEVEVGVSLNGGADVSLLGARVGPARYTGSDMRCVRAIRATRYATPRRAAPAERHVTRAARGACGALARSGRDWWRQVHVHL